MKYRHLLTIPLLLLSCNVSDNKTTLANKQAKKVNQEEEIVLREQFKQVYGEYIFNDTTNINCKIQFI